MPDRTPTSEEERTPPSSRRARDLMRAVDGWLADGRANGWSQRTLTDHRQNLGRFSWWLVNEAEEPPTIDSITAANVRAFMGYLREPHPTGRFGSDNPLAKRAARPSTVHAYHRDLRAFTRFLMADEVLTGDPLKNVKAPKIPADQILPLTVDQVQALLDAARRGQNPERDTALIFTMVDSGLRASEVCDLTIGDLDGGTGELTVRSGKGGKLRKSFVSSPAARRAVNRYIEAKRRLEPAEAPLFVSRGGFTPGEKLTRSGLGIIVRNLGKAAGITGVRVSPHTLRHTMALNYLKRDERTGARGGEQIELMGLLGHTSLEMTRRYVLLADTDRAQAHRAASPAARMNLK